jgi:hypothetical protein
MTLTVDLPADIIESLRQSTPGDLNTYARHALLVQMYRDRKLTHGQLQRILGIGSYEVDTLLKAHGGVDEISAEELAEQVQASFSARQRSKP